MLVIIIYNFIIHSSEIFSVQYFIAFLQYYVSCIPKFVLFSDIAHIKELFVVEDKQCFLSIEIGDSKDRYEWPHNELLKHEHSDNASNISNCKRIYCSSHVNIISVFSSCYIRPVLFNGCFIVRGTLVQNVSSEECVS